MDNGGFGKRVRADEFVVGGVEGYANDADFAGYALRPPRKVAGVEAESTVFGVATTRADEMDTFSANTGVGWLTALFKGSNFLSV